MKVSLVTGGSRGIGAETVKQFAKNGYTVILNYCNSKQSAENLQRQLLADGCDVHLFPADVSDSKQVAAMFDWVAKYFKKLDVLVNNAGVALSTLCQDVSDSQYDYVMNTNAKGTFLCCRHAIPLFLKNGCGSIVNLASIWGLRGASCESVYSMSKHAVVGLTKSLAKELAFSNVNVNCICPPLVTTDMCSHLSESDIINFCEENNVSRLSPQQVALDVFRLATSGCTGKILEE